LSQRRRALQKRSYVRGSAFSTSISKTLVTAPLSGSSLNAHVQDAGHVNQGAVVVIGQAALRHMREHPLLHLRRTAEAALLDVVDELEFFQRRRSAWID